MTFIAVFDETDHYIVNSFNVPAGDEPSRHCGPGRNWMWGEYDKGRYYAAYDPENDVWYGALKTPEALVAGLYREPDYPVWE